MSNRYFKAWLDEKSNKLFLNLEKYQASDNTIRKVIPDAQEITDHKKNKHSFVL